jgi:Zn finger protein HypA/HybF involved in hydrogenase expression
MPKDLKGREDERDCQCNNCESWFREGEIKIKGDKEYCPVCGKSGFIDDNIMIFQEGKGVYFV